MHKSYEYDLYHEYRVSNECKHVLSDAFTIIGTMSGNHTLKLTYLTEVTGLFKSCSMSCLSVLFNYLNPLELTHFFYSVPDSPPI